MTNFIEDSGLMDISLFGGRFTWCNNRLVHTYCRLDRFLLSPDFLSKFSRLVQKVLPRSLSDHNMVSLNIDEVNWGPKPFKFFNN